MAAFNALIFSSNEEEAQAGADALNSYFSTVSPPRFVVTTHPTMEDRWAVGDSLLTQAEMIAAVDQPSFAAALNAYGADAWRGIGEHAPPPVPVLEPSAESWGVSSAFNKFNSFVEAVAEKVHNLGSDQIVVALCAAANAPVATNTQLSNLTQISYTNLSSRNVTTTSSSQTSGLYKLVLQDLVLTASGTVPAFRYVVLYNDTATNDELIGWYDYGSDLTLLTGETFTIDFDGTGGALTLQ